MTLIFIGVLSFLLLRVSSFNKSDCQIALTSSLMMNGPQPQSTGISGLGAICWSPNKSCNICQNQFPTFRMHFSEFGLR